MGGLQTDQLLIENHRSFAQAVAAEIIRTLPPWADAGDLRAAAELGLTEAAAVFDYRPGVQFQRFAYHRIRGAVYDAVRKNAPALTLSLETLEHDPPADRSQSAEERLIEEEWRARLHRVLPRLSAQNRQIIYAYYFEDRNLEDIGVRLGLSKSWVCRLHGRAIASLRNLLLERSLAA